ncbi:MAG TPA: TlpA disulfide reductase family protein [Pyrinomonadaceae bacterium]
MLVSLFVLLLFAACKGAPAPEVAKPAAPKATPTPVPQRAARPQPSVVTPGSAKVEQYGFTLLDNRRQKLSDYAGQVVVLDFYATWCPPCREETPHLVSLQKRYGAQGLHVIGLNVGGPEDRYKVPEYVEEFKIQYTLGFPDPQLTAQYLSDDDRIPQAFVFDRKGRLVKRFISYDNTMPAELERIVQNALNTGE